MEINVTATFYFAQVKNNVSFSAYICTIACKSLCSMNNSGIFGVIEHALEFMHAMLARKWRDTSSEVLVQAEKKAWRDVSFQESSSRNVTGLFPWNVNAQHPHLNFHKSYFLAQTLPRGLGLVIVYRPPELLQ
jgi:hypothetical protein